jgi:uncharacterized protein
VQCQLENSGLSLLRRHKNDLIERMHWDFALILIVLGVAVPLLGWRRIRQLMQAPKTTKSVRLKLYASTTASQWIAASVIFWRARAHGIQAAQLGIEIPSPGLILSVSIALTALILVNQVVSLRALSEHQEEIKGVLPQLAQRIFPQDNAERGAFSGVVLTVALCEEFIFRGFVQYLFQDWSGGSILFGIIGSSALFAWAHLYQGRRGLLSTFLAGLVFSGVRAWTGSLLPSFCAHFGADLVIGWMAPSRLVVGRESLSELPK